MSSNVVSGTLDHNPNEANLIPLLPANIRDTRYQSDIRVKISSTTIPLGANFGSAPSYQPQGWTISVHPEGKRYAYNQAQAGITFVTEAHVLEPGVSDQLDGWVTMIRGLAADNHVHVPVTSDLFIEVDQKLGNCYYYFADHGHRTVFWLHTVDTITVGLPDSCSKGHLQYALEENYWTHVEMFPDTASRYSMTALNELQNLLLHARADALTSDVPTFPYTGEENERFIDILQRGKEYAPNAYVTTYVARLWVIVANHRFFTHFGEDHCRMSSCQSVLDTPKRKQNLILAAISKALFDLPNGRRTRLEGLWVDDLAYTSTWRKYVSETVEDLKQSVIWCQSSHDTNFSLSGLDKFIHANLHLRPGHIIHPLSRTTKACRHGQCHSGEHADT
ncbi:hypothetical protein BJV78DRAFT_545954 [Lactifluus subvellereus]|nr:hypothetical protein BJV78DRAFT_545954 [Lactifluus subvellereus]